MINSGENYHVWFLNLLLKVGGLSIILNIRVLYSLKNFVMLPQHKSIEIDMFNKRTLNFQ